LNRSVLTMLVLNPNLEQRLNATAETLGVSAQDLLDEAVSDDLQDTRTAEEVCRQLDSGEAVTTPWLEVEKHFPSITAARLTAESS
jgi:predicted DNA-binding protein